MKKGTFVFVFALIFIGILGIALAGMYNEIPSLDEGIKEKWSKVQNQYKRRVDLIPNLVKTVNAYASHEKSTFLEVIDARNKVSQIKIDQSTIDSPEQMQTFINAQQGLGGALSKLMVVVERYPDLKVDKNFLALQKQLEGTENRIAVARKDFIESNKDYNLALRTFPSNFIAKIFSLN